MVYTVLIVIMGLVVSGAIIFSVVMSRVMPRRRRPLPPVDLGPREIIEGPTEHLSKPSEIWQGRLAITNGPKRGEHYDIDGREVSIGRSRSNQIILDDPYVSRVAAGIYRDKDQFVIYDRGSFQGLLVNNEDITTSSAVLVDGSVIQMGETFLQFNIVKIPVSAR